jgi:hypothetical protein
MEEEEETEWRGEGEVCGGSEGGACDGVATIVQEKKECGGDGGGAGDGSGSVVVECGEDGAGQGEEDGQGCEVAQGEVCDWVGRAIGGVIFVLPGVDEEAVEAAESGEEECGGE